MSKAAIHRRRWEAIQEKVCAVCLDQADDGTCGLAGRTCPIERFLPDLAAIASSVESSRMDEYVSAVEATICARCPDQDMLGRCDLRARGQCALNAYLPLVVDVLEEPL
jgi:hypothetical protein